MLRNYLTQIIFFLCEIKIFLCILEKKTLNLLIFIKKILPINLKCLPLHVKNPENSKQ